MFLDFEPETVEVTTCSTVVHDFVERIGNPERSSSDIGLEHRPDLLGTNHEILFDNVVGFNTVFQEDIVSSAVVTNVVLDL